MGSPEKSALQRALLRGGDGYRMELGRNGLLPEQLVVGEIRA